MKKIISRIKEKQFTDTEHIEEMQLALFKEGKLDKNAQEAIWQHLSQCQECREVLKIASELATTHKQQHNRPANNPNYQGALRRLGGVAAIFIIFLAIPHLDQSSETTFKGACEEQGIFEKAWAYWGKKFEGWVDLMGG